MGRRLAPKLGIHYCDIDELRAVAFGIPTHEEYARIWQNPTEATQRTHENMILAYRLLHEVANLTLEAGKSLIISATYASKTSQEFLMRIVQKHDALVRFILCRIDHETRGELERRMRRDDEKKFIHGTGTWSDYERVRSRYQWPHESGVIPSANLYMVNTTFPVDDLGPIMEFVLNS